MVALQRLTQRNALVREALDYRASPLPAMGEDPPSPDLDTGERDTVSVSPGSTV
ncbi:hypothetical protein DACRYDRAFT_24801 [Dacryopinax primogenitus]|uniref:Uncharacterized protein n=1 Tax=Dacryopinax primogenitus (strain DJM 731) TaxID=1858805 RepID=M5FNR8_DACPD|nr:uncharacterized protein DACRYDRAFT_24801 [Dacryopinax primogenitus]EJT97850.1 hypothetical protein DACRYDRAFT_24801 [Dacryopinax primogenitus]